MSSILKSFRVDVRATYDRGPTTRSQGPIAADHLLGTQPSALGAAVSPDPSPLTAYEEGLALGRQEGLAQAQQEALGLLQTAHGIVAEVTRWQHEQLARELPEVVGLAVAIAERIVRREVAVDGQAVIRALEEAARQREARGLVRIAVNPGEVDAVREHWQQTHPGQAEVEVYADPGVERGGCLLMSESSLIDALLETQLDVIARELDREWRVASDD